MQAPLINWSSVFQPSIGLAEIILRGSIMYLALFLILRFIARRQSGGFGPADLLVIVLIADAAQNALGKDYESITEGIVLVATIVAWEYILDWLAWRFPALRPFIKVPPLKLVEGGRTLDQNMQREMISNDELLGQLREQGVDDLRLVKVAYLEANGRVSVIKAE